MVSTQAQDHSMPQTLPLMVTIQPVGATMMVSTQATPHLEAVAEDSTQECLRREHPPPWWVWPAPESVPRTSGVRSTSVTSLDTIPTASTAAQSISRLPDSNCPVRTRCGALESVSTQDMEDTINAGTTGQYLQYQHLPSIQDHVWV